ncbi:LPS export ABC transporter periplasmic protein LptC [Polaribacter sp. Hel_I_88]|uniref:LPS export ABC transporter periplasmic protein LptC n=1 Tax=Polaribacter sp. Hel_I_88 TaxID=1250006 RepID=UPI000A67CD53|nr:LPS export ABC transporter periplasmic protein LptC [Polaribacter sp. Hel_I_88]
MINYNKTYSIITKSIAVLFVTAMLFACTNNTQKARDFLADKNLPVGISKDAYHVYKDSGRITSKLITPKMLDFSNREKHPYNEFPFGIKIINFENKGKDSITITGNYAISYAKTSISEIKGNVIVINHADKSRLETEQLFWDEKTKYFVSEKAFKLTKENDTIFGIGFESKDDLSKHLAKKTTGKLETKED